MFFVSFKVLDECVFLRINILKEIDLTMFEELTGFRSDKVEELNSSKNKTKINTYSVFNLRENAF